jgi:hypothetical protein
MTPTDEPCEIAERVDQCDAASGPVGQRLEFGAGDLRIHDRDASCVPTELRDRRSPAPVRQANQQAPERLHDKVREPSQRSPSS